MYAVCPRPADVGPGVQGFDFGGDRGHSRQLSQSSPPGSRNCTLGVSAGCLKSDSQDSGNNHLASQNSLPEQESHLRTALFNSLCGLGGVGSCCIGLFNAPVLGELQGSKAVAAVVLMGRSMSHGLDWELICVMMCALMDWSFGLESTCFKTDMQHWLLKSILDSREAGRQPHTKTF